MTPKLNKFKLHVKCRMKETTDRTPWPTSEVFPSNLPRDAPWDRLQNLEPWWRHHPFTIALWGLACLFFAIFGQIWVIGPTYLKHQSMTVKPKENSVLGPWAIWPKLAKQNWRKIKEQPFIPWDRLQNLDSLHHNAWHIVGWPPPLK